MRSIIEYLRKIGSRKILNCNLTQWSYDTRDRATGKRYVRWK